MKKRVLHISIKREYFEQIKDGSKLFEYRDQTAYWAKRLVGRDYDEVHFKLGYPKANDFSRIEVRPYRGFERQTIVHKHFGNTETDVFAIRAN